MKTCRRWTRVLLATAGLLAGIHMVPGLVRTSEASGGGLCSIITPAGSVPAIPARIQWNGSTWVWTPGQWRFYSAGQIDWLCYWGFGAPTYIEWFWWDYNAQRANLWTWASGAPYSVNAATPN